MIPLTDYEKVLQRDLASFIVRTFYEINPETKLHFDPYIEVIATHLAACLLGKCKRLIIALPPRHLKSHCVSMAFVAWLLGYFPSAQIICATYGQDLSDKQARDCLRLMQSPLYRRLFGTRISPKRMAAHDFFTTKNGNRFATSVGGVVTGRGADWIIVDDPLKASDALSETARNAANEWFDGPLLTRLNNKATGVVIIVMQRLHQDDLVGHALEKGGDWKVLSLPAIAEQDEFHLIEGPFGRRFYYRKEGEVLSPNRESPVTLELVRNSIGEYNFSAQYQQNPTPVGGAMVKTSWLVYVDPTHRPKNFSRIVLSWDTANKSNELNDFSVCTVWGVLDKKFHLLDVIRARFDYPALRRKAVELAKQYRGCNIVIEDKASGTQLLQDLKAEGVSLGLHPYLPPPHTDKIVRLHMQTTLFENGHVILPTHAPWLAEYVKELISFPGARHDDQVDSTTQALAYMREPDPLEVWRILGRQK